MDSIGPTPIEHIYAKFTTTRSYLECFSKDHSWSQLTGHLGVRPVSCILQIYLFVYDLLTQLHWLAYIGRPLQTWGHDQTSTAV